GFRGEGALAVAGQGLAVAARVREGEPPAVFAVPLEAVGGEWQIETKAMQDCGDGAIEAVRDDLDGVPQSGAKGDKTGKPRVNCDAGHELIDFRWAGADQVDLAHHAFARADAAGFPVLFDVAPRGGGKALQE